MQPQSPPPNQPYDFILKDGQKPKKSLLPSMSGPVLIIAIVLGLTVLLIIFSVLFLGKGKSSTTDLIEVLGRAQEINRVNSLQQPQLKDPNTVALLATTQSALTSEQAEINSYAKANKIKISPKKLVVYKNTQTDSQLQTAAQNNSLDAAYLAYLKQSLESYSSSISKAYSDTRKTDLQAILKRAYDSTQTLLGNPPKST